MAYYISDPKIVEMCRLDSSIKFICDFIYLKSENNIHVEYLDDDTILLQVIGFHKNRPDHSYYSNIVGINDKQIYVNPISDINGESICEELKIFIETEVPIYVRDNKISELITS